MNRAIATLAVSCMLISPAAGSELSLSVDVPSDLGGVTFLATQTIRAHSSGFELRFDGPGEGLPPGLDVTGLAILDDGSFLFTVDAPFEISGTTFLPRDVVRFGSGAFDTFLDLGLLGLSESAHVDAVAALADGALAVSFDRPETVLGAATDPGDVIRLDGIGLSVLFDASTHGLGVDANVVAYDALPDGKQLLVFDTPVTTPSGTFMPGDVLELDGVDFSVFFADPGLAAYAGYSAVSLPGSPGTVGGLRIARTGSDVELSWLDSCSSEGSDYSVYEGQLGDFDSHLPVGCDTGGATTATVTPGAGDRYFLIVPRNEVFEGSYGTDGVGTERPASTGACESLQLVRECP